MSEEVKALATNMILRKRSEAGPYVLFLGAGASMSSGCSSMMQIVDDVLQSHVSKQFGDWNREIEEAKMKDPKYGELLRQEISRKKRDHFFIIWDKMDHDTRYSILRKHLWEDKSLSKGYIDLANLIKNGYFKTVLSTNLDNLLEKALTKVGWSQPEDFIVIVNSRDNPEEVLTQIESFPALFKIIKLHGTLESPRTYAFTPSEVFEFEEAIESIVSQTINQSLVVVGHSMQDRDLEKLFDREGKEIHFVNPSRPEIGSLMDFILKVRRKGSIVEGTEGEFDNFFQKLRSCIEDQSEASIRESASSIEGFLKSIGYEHELEVPRSRYRSLPSLFVKPREYDDICTKLEKDHTVFIMGEPHLGKTYTAFYILWEYYQKGYGIVHMKHDQLINQLQRYDNNMKKLLLDLFACDRGFSRIIHFDDPFGETTDRRTDVFAKGLNVFLDLARGYEHMRVIVTTRLNIFRESVAGAHGIEMVEELEKDMRVHTSYSSDTLLDILHRYTHFYDPLWASNEEIVKSLDQQLPDLLPAPHNIEFFVRTSERLNSLEDVLNHVETCKEMVKALADWMIYLPDHEKLFLIWLEICSTAGILFPGDSASMIDFESAYRETLAYMYRKRLVEGIPLMAFPLAKDKFDMILLESRDEKTGSKRYDFVHPSYHEATWYAIKDKTSLYHLWEMLKGNLDEILKDLNNKIDLVQVCMIERYGKINRDMVQLLLLSAKSDDLKEQSIAFEHMIDHLEQFKDLPEFSHCAICVIRSEEEKDRYDFLELTDHCFDKLPSDVVNAAAQLLFDPEVGIRLKAEKIISRCLDTFPESVRQNKTIEAWRILNDILAPSEESVSDREYDILSIVESISSPFAYSTLSIGKSAILREAFKSFLKSSEDLELVNRISYTKLEKELLRDQRIIDTISLTKFGKELLRDRGPITIISKTISEDLADRITRIPPADLQLLFESEFPFFPEIIIPLILGNYEKLSQEQREAFIAMKSSPIELPALKQYLDHHKFDFKDLSNSLLMDLLSFPVHIQYIILPGILLRFRQLSEEEKHAVNDLFNNPPDWWVGGSVGKMTSKKFFKTYPKLNKNLRNLPIKLSRQPNKKIAGALLAEMVQNHWNGKLGLQEMYFDIVRKLLKDSEIIQYAEAWMDYEPESLGFHKKEYWSNAKNRLLEWRGPWRDI